MYALENLKQNIFFSSSEVGSQCCTALREMGDELSRNRSAKYHRLSKWTQHTDCGGLYHVKDGTIELLVDKELSAVFNTKGKGLKRSEKRRSHGPSSVMMKSLWRIISSRKKVSVSIYVLQEIIYLRITTRDHSEVNDIKEGYKKAKGKSVKVANSNVMPTHVAWISLVSVFGVSGVVSGI